MKYMKNNNLESTVSIFNYCQFWIKSDRFSRFSRCSTFNRCNTFNGCNKINMQMTHIVLWKSKYKGILKYHSIIILIFHFA